MKSGHWLRGLGLGCVGFVVTTACGETVQKVDCVAGTETCACYPNHTCNEPFVCLSSLCVLDDRRSLQGGAGAASEAEPEPTGDGGRATTAGRGAGGASSGDEHGPKAGAGASSVDAPGADGGSGGGQPLAGAPNEGGAAGASGPGAEGGAGGAYCVEGGTVPFVQIGEFPSPSNAVQLAYSPRRNRLMMRNAASTVTVLDTLSGQSASHLANARFTDVSLSPDGRYAFVSDYGGENIGYGTPLGQSYVHRVDLADGTWGVQKVSIAGSVEAVSGTRFLLQSLDQWISFSYYGWSDAGLAANLLSSSYGWVYGGSFVYDWRRSRFVHGNAGISSQELNAFKLQDDQFTAQEGTGTYGSASGHGGTLALATDGSRVYYGRLSVDAADVAHTLDTFPESIYAATGDLAFGQGNVYDVTTRELVFELGFSTTVYGLSPDNPDFWTFDAQANLLRHYAPIGWCGTSASGD
jgi:hypothetical protein